MTWPAYPVAVPREFHRPVRMPHLDGFLGEEDPAVRFDLAHETARTLVERGRGEGAAELVERMVRFTDEHGIDALADLWSASGPETLPGALWRLSLVRVLIRQRGDDAAAAFRDGIAALRTADAVIAGAPSPITPAELAELADRILRGAYAGDLGDALDRAAATCRLLASGWLQAADRSEVASAQRAVALTRRAARLSTIGEELHRAARLERAGRLD